MILYESYAITSESHAIICEIREIECYSGHACHVHFCNSMIEPHA